MDFCNGLQKLAEAMNQINKSRDPELWGPAGVSNILWERQGLGPGSAYYLRGLIGLDRGGFCTLSTFLILIPNYVLSITPLRHFLR
jgi:hypothetical protein